MASPGAIELTELSSEWPDKDVLMQLMKAGRDHGAMGQFASCAVNYASIPDRDTLMAKYKKDSTVDAILAYNDELKGNALYPFYAGTTC
jgi:hypothetical protein